MLKHIPFLREDEECISSVALWATIIAVTSLISAAIDIVTKLVMGGGSTKVLVTVFFGAAISVPIVVLLAVFLLKAAGALRKVATTDVADEHYLLQGFRNLRNYFMTTGIILIVVLSIGALILFGALVCGIGRF